VDELIQAGLTASPKRLPAALLYDDLGSALFEAITLLPEYGVGRADMALLQKHAAEIIQQLPGDLEVVELGPGGGTKAKVMLEPLVARQEKTRFVAIDVSPAALEECRRKLTEHSQVEVVSIVSNFLDGLRRSPSRPHHRRRLVMFLGSNLSNFDRDECQQFFRGVRAELRPNDALLLSADLPKPVEQLLNAYDDALRVTAAFNRNVLVRLNREYGANFEVSSFAHEARWNESHRRVEMHLRALTAQNVRVDRLDLALRFKANETLWTESSHRFTVQELTAWGHNAALESAGTWVNRDWPLALCLFVAKPSSNAFNDSSNQNNP
jgi:dimethylhistidine N-methyltransferase